MKKIFAMACAVVDKDGKILLLKRSPDKKLSPNKWFVVGASPLDENENFEKIAHREMRDELGIEGEIIGKTDKIRVVENGLEIVVHPFMARAKSENIILNDEHTDFNWVVLEDLGKYDLVSGTKEMIFKLLNRHE